jgi:hypothetical protein
MIFLVVVCIYILATILLLIQGGPLADQIFPIVILTFVAYITGYATRLLEK